MPIKYICELCNKQFIQKSDYNKHKNKKAPCISLTIMKEITEKQLVKKDNQSELTTIFKACFNYMRNEGVTGMIAILDLSYLLVIKLIEPNFIKEIDIDNIEYYLDNPNGYDNDQIKELLKLVRFSNLIKEKDDDLTSNLTNIWQNILAFHPSTNQIFLENGCLNTKGQSNIKKIIKELSKIDSVNTDIDILGKAYGETISEMADTGKGLGQFFTPLCVKKLMIKLIQPKLHPDGKIDTCCDPTMGTGGLLVEYIKDIQLQSKVKNIKIDWEFIKENCSVYGKEIQKDTHQLAISNLFISTGYMLSKLEDCNTFGDSIREPIIRKFDNILANPPFGIKGLKFDELTINEEERNRSFPIKSDNAVSLFIQTIINSLKINGKCAVVLPHGQDLFSKANMYVTIREYLMKTCDLKEIIYLPAGIFEYTSIKTCVFFFVKKREGADVLETVIKTSKNHKEIGREYKFSKTHQTSVVKFYEYNQVTDEKHSLIDIDIKDIANNSYSLNYTEYMKDDVVEYEEGIVIKTLGEVCDFLPKSKRQASYGKTEGIYPFFTSSQSCSKYCDQYDYDEECLIIGTGGNANIKYSSKFSCSTDNLIIKIKQTYLLKYIYYYLSINIELLEKGFVGVGIKHISKEYLSKIKIPIPSIENQNEIVKYLDFIYEKSNKTSNEKIKELQMLNKFCLNNQKLFGDNDIKTLGEITTYKSGKRLPQGHILQNDKTPYPYIRITDIYKNTISLDNIKYITQETKDIISKYIITKDDIYITIAGTTGLVGIIPNELDGANLTENAVKINIIDKDVILQKYLVCDIHYNQKKELKLKTAGAAIPKLSIERLMTLKIHIPSLERQQEIVNYCKNNDKLIKKLEQEIETNKEHATLFIKSIVKIQANPSEETDIEDTLDYEQE